MTAVFLRLEVAEPRVLQVARDRFVNQSWRQLGTVYANRGQNRDRLSTTVLACFCKVSTLIQLSSEDPSGLLQLSHEKALLVHVVLYMLSALILYSSTF